ncbi:MAG TPA: NAD-binding protein [Streptosporangiaceae bacterium]
MTAGQHSAPVAAGQPEPRAAAPAYPHLFSPLRVGPVTLKNRIVNSAHQTGFATARGYGPQLVAYHRERARGGAGLIVSQATCVTPEYLDLWNVDDSIVGQYRVVMDAVREHGAHYVAELFHPGRQSEYTGSGAAVYRAPSAVPLHSYGVEWRVPHALEPAAIRTIIAAFRAAAERCRAGGLSGVLLHFAHGNLVEQFMSPKTNLRVDEWGGPLGNRLRLAREILLAVREAVGRGLAVGARITGCGLDPGEPGELDMLEIAGTIDSWGLADYLDVTMGHYSDAMNTARNIPNMTFTPGLWARVGKGVKNVVGVPVFLVGRVNHPQVAEELIAGGSCDAVVMARALIADPYFPAKAAAGQADQIRPCVGAMNCFNHLHHGGSIRCIHNAVVSREERWGGPLPPASQPRKVAVVGGGPSGLECARVAARRGHQVVLLERDIRLGGQVRIAAKAPQRGELAQITEWLERRCGEAGVEVRLGAEATGPAIAGIGPAAVVIATGSHPSPAGFPTDLPVTDAAAVLAGEHVPGQHVVLFDEFGDWQAMSVAHALAARGAAVDFVTPTAYPGSALDLTNWRVTYQRLTELGVRFHPVAEITAAQGSEVVINRGFGTAEQTIGNVDAVVAVTMPAARDELYRELRGGPYELHVTGDALAPRGIEEAIYDGYQTGREL